MLNDELRTGFALPGPPGDEPPTGVGRRRVLTWLVAAPALTMAVKLGLDGKPAAADPLGLGEFVDIGDLLYAVNLPTALDLVIEVTPDNRVVAALTRLESGQGITTMMAMLLAEELGARLSDVDITLADADPLEVLMFTGGSNTARVLYEPTRIAASGMRARLVTAAANRWGVPAGRLITKDTKVYAPDGRSATFAELSGDAAKVLTPAIAPKPKPDSECTVIGKPTGRIETPELVRGQAKYTLDLDVPGALPTVVARPPTIGGTVQSVDDSAARALPGVVAVTRLPTGVAVTGRTFHDAFQGRDALTVRWKPGPVAGMSDGDITKKLKAAALPFLVPPVLGKAVDGTFDFAYLSHSPMEVRVAIADVQGGKATVWLPSQAPIDAQNKIAAAVGLLPTAVTVHVPRAGGAFGGRLTHEPGIEAAEVSKKIGRPVKLMWSRVDDMKHGRFRLASHHEVRAVVQGTNVTSFEHRCATPEMEFDHGLGEAATAAGFSLPPTRAALIQAAFQLTQQTPYHFGLVNQLLSEVNVPIPNATWRSVYSGQVAVTNEIMADEIAKAVGQDPLTFRRAKVKADAVRGVLDTVADKGDWGRSMPEGTAQGIALHAEYKSAVAFLVELDCREEQPKATKIVAAVDVGLCINPRGVEAQMQGAAVDALSTIFWAGNHIDDGAVRESSFSDFRYARMRQVPSTTVHINSTSSHIGGVGELGYPAAAAAFANAYARATGKKPRSFPIFHGA
ncbi:isoquinoline 1-oxidoreductase beta subunit [Tamaricihabitans halophyticus]|uniref:Isoquinoline 1-oxidoreductase beta subunit n=1 Tax=Tamaricihabitans halophyticus TaxID=1262583 RepID=A0A4R2PYW1_9PSEU|nr:molybdopterin cofactor-binding domain-containing protein [Tamaricihabitans halophyticus]TCP41229.1 isoquinoline 1-oxidoreductase beta subunit [Tamaricihabitans halophyticus]